MKDLGPVSKSLGINFIRHTDGSVTVDNFRAQVGDSFIITEDGYEAITDHPKSIDDVII